MRIRDVLSRPVVTVGPDTLLRDAIPLLTDNGFGGLPVVDADDHVVGILCESDALGAGQDDFDTKVADVMTGLVTSIAPGDEVGIAAKQMLVSRLPSVPVVEHGVLVGIVSRRDLLGTMVHDDDVLAAQIRDRLDEYAGSTRQWRVDVKDGRVVVAGGFADEAEQRVVRALVDTVAGVRHTDIQAAWSIPAHHAHADHK